MNAETAENIPTDNNDANASGSPAESFAELFEKSNKQAVRFSAVSAFMRE